MKIDQEPAVSHESRTDLFIHGGNEAPVPSVIGERRWNVKDAGKSRDSSQQRREMDGG